ncbi:MAG: hypothetical protein Kow0059_08090 [Candidatus Sumerlaeia bacterium]
MDSFIHDPGEAPRIPAGLVDPDLDDPEAILEHQISENDHIREGLARFKFDLAQVLTSRNPELQFPEAVQIAVQAGASLESACRPFRILTLRAAATNDVQIDLFDFGARISIPFAVIGDEVRQIFGEVWEYINVLKRAADYLAYDPQLGRLIKNTADMILAMTGYEYLFTEQLKAKKRAVARSDSSDPIGDDVTQPLRPDRLKSSGLENNSPSADPLLSNAAEGVSAAPVEPDSPQAGAPEPRSATSAAATPARKSWWKFW